MIAEASLRCSRYRTLQLGRWRKYPVQRQPRRRSLSTSAGASVQAARSPASMLGGLYNELDRLAPRFEIDASQIEILHTPGDFYEILKSKILKARTRIYLSTLYIGKEEHELISVIRQALQNQPDLKVAFLTDALRGTRETPNPSCASLLTPLIADFGAERVEVRMFHTPNLTGLRKRYIPKRINEGWGLQHMKLYGIDDEVIMSGANLSNDYFTNRQDRYHMLSSKEITEYFESVHKAVSNLSYRVRPDPQDESGYLLEWPETNHAPAPLDDPSGYISQAGSVLNALIKPQASSTVRSVSAKSDTTVYPLAQFTPLLRPDTSTEHPGLTAVLRLLTEPSFVNSQWTFTAGYFNIQPNLSQLLLDSASRRGTVITASPWANGFYGSKGVSGLLPPAYTLLSRRFLERVQRANRSSQIELKEWRQGTVGEPGGWTYHAKGLWITLPGEQDPSITLVGSSNYTKRSYSLDLEMNALVVTRNEKLKRRLGEEQAWLQEHASKVGIDDFTTPERRVSIKVRIAMWIVSLVGGAL